MIPLRSVLLGSEIRARRLQSTCAVSTVDECGAREYIPRKERMVEGCSIDSRWVITGQSEALRRKVDLGQCSNAYKVDSNPRLHAPRRTNVKLTLSIPQ